MAIIKGFKSATVEDVTPYEMPTDDIAKGILAREGRSTEAKNAIDEVASEMILDVRDHEQDQAKALEYQNNYNRDIDELVNKYGGDYSQIDRAEMQAIAMKHAGSNEMRHLKEARRNQDQHIAAKAAIEAKGEVAEVFYDEGYHPVSDALYDPETNEARHFTNRSRVEQKLDPMERVKTMFDKLGYKLKEKTGYTEGVDEDWYIYWRKWWESNKDNRKEVAAIVNGAVDDFKNGTKEGAQYYNILMRDKMADGLKRTDAHNQAMAEMQDLIAYTGRSVEIDEHKETLDQQTRNKPQTRLKGTTGKSVPKQEKAILSRKKVPDITHDAVVLSGDETNALEAVSNYYNSEVNLGDLNGVETVAQITSNSPAMNAYMLATSPVSSAEENPNYNNHNISGGFQKMDGEVGEGNSTANRAVTSMSTHDGSASNPIEDPSKQQLFEDTREDTWENYNGKLPSIDRIITESGDNLITAKEYVDLLNDNSSLVNGMSLTEKETYKLLKGEGSQKIKFPTISTMSIVETQNEYGPSTVEIVVNPVLIALKEKYEKLAADAAVDNREEGGDGPNYNLKRLYDAKVKLVNKKITGVGNFTKDHAVKIEAFKTHKRNTDAEFRMLEEVVEVLFKKHNINYDDYKEKVINGETGDEFVLYKTNKKKSFKSALEKSKGISQLLFPFGPDAKADADRLLTGFTDNHGEKMTDKLFTVMNNLIEKGITLSDIQKLNSFNHAYAIDVMSTDHSKDEKITKEGVSDYIKSQFYQYKLGDYGQRIGQLIDPFENENDNPNATLLIDNMINNFWGLGDTAGPNSGYTTGRGYGLGVSGPNGERLKPTYVKYTDTEMIVRSVYQKEFAKNYESDLISHYKDKFDSNLALMKDIEQLTDPVNTEGFIILTIGDTEKGGFKRTRIEEQILAPSETEYRRVTHDNKTHKEIFNPTVFNTALEKLWHAEKDKESGGTTLNFTQWKDAFLKSPAVLKGIRRDVTNIEGYGNDKAVKGNSEYVAHLVMDLPLGDDMETTSVTLETDVTMSYDELVLIYGESAYEIKLGEQERQGLKRNKGHYFDLTGLGPNKSMRVYKANWDWSTSVNGDPIKKGEYFVLEDGEGDPNAGDPEYNLSKNLRRRRFKSYIDYMSFFKEKNSKQYAEINRISEIIYKLEHDARLVDVINGYNDPDSPLYHVSRRTLIEGFKKRIYDISNEEKRGRASEYSSHFIQGANFNKYYDKDGSGSIESPIIKDNDIYTIPKKVWSNLSGGDKKDVAFAINETLQEETWTSEGKGEKIQHYAADPKTLINPNSNLELQNNFTVPTGVDMRLSDKTADFLTALNELISFRKTKDRSNPAYISKSIAYADLGITETDIDALSNTDKIYITSALRSVQANLRAYNTPGSDITKLSNSPHMKGNSIDIRTQHQSGEDADYVPAGASLWTFFKSTSGAAFLKKHGMSAFFHTVNNSPSGLHIDISVNTKKRATVWENTPKSGWKKHHE